VRLKCKIVSGMDDNTISWDVNGKPLKDDLEKYDILVTDTGYEYISELMIQNVEKDDFTSYGCEAANQMGYDYVRINLEQLEFNNEIWYIIISVLVLLIILATFGFCFLLGRRRRVNAKTNAELIKEALERESKENEYVKEKFEKFDTNHHEMKIRGPDPDLIPIMKNAKQLPKNLLSPVDDFTDDEDDFGTNYKISPIDDEESHIYAKLTRPHSYGKNQFSSNPSISSLDTNDSQSFSSLDSANSAFNRKVPPLPSSRISPKVKKPFVIKNLYVKPNREENCVKQTKFIKNNVYVGDIIDDEDDKDDQYVTLLPESAQNFSIST